MSNLAFWIFGFFVGGLFGVLIMAICAAGKKGDNDGENIL